MCSINGSTWVDVELVRRMNARTLHRGPDGTAVTVVGEVTLGHDRLAIIDPDPRSNQPMTSADGRYTIVYNGEIYNYKELRSTIHEYRFTTESDTEVILAGFAKEGKSFFNKMNGVYALAIHDAHTGVLTLARDPMGVNPLYLAKTPRGWVFSSEIKGVLECGMARTVQREAFGAYMRTLFVPGPATMFEGVEHVMPGTLVEIRGGERTVSAITYQARSELLDPQDSAGLKEAVTDAVVRQLLSDRPLGIYLSGGIDSSAILAAAMTVRKSMDTFSVSFALSPEEEREKFNADALIARRSAKHFGATHHDLVIGPDQVFRLLSEAAYSLDEPVGNATSAAQLALAAFARKTAVVVLTGDGGDEVFAGYPRYRLARTIARAQQIVPARVWRTMPGRLKKLGTPTQDQFGLFHYQKDAEITDLLAEPPKVASLFPHGSTAVSLMEMDRSTWLVDEALLRTNKLSMAHALEPRPPLLDLELVAAAAGFPFESQVSPFDSKILFKRAFADVLPGWILNQPKRGWFSPGAKWLRHPALARDIDRALAPGFAPATDSLFHWDGVRTALAEHREKRRYRAPALIAILMFQLWAKAYGVSL